MRQLVLASVNPAPVAQRAHDIRNALATAGLHLEALERSFSCRREIAQATHAPMARAVDTCDDSMALNTQSDAAGRWRSFDIVKTIVQITNPPRASAPDGFDIPVAASPAFIVQPTPTRLSRPA